MLPTLPGLLSSRYMLQNIISFKEAYKGGFMHLSTT